MVLAELSIESIGAVVSVSPSDSSDSSDSSVTPSIPSFHSPSYRDQPTKVSAEVLNHFLDPFRFSYYNEIIGGNCEKMISI